MNAPWEGRAMANLAIAITRTGGWVGFACDPDIAVVGEVRGGRVFARPPAVRVMVKWSYYCQCGSGTAEFNISLDTLARVAAFTHGVVMSGGCDGCTGDARDVRMR